MTLQKYMYKVSENYVELYLRLITLSLLYFLITIQNSYIGGSSEVLCFTQSEHLGYQQSLWSVQDIWVVPIGVLYVRLIDLFECFSHVSVPVSDSLFNNNKWTANDSPCSTIVMSSSLAVLQCIVHWVLQVLLDCNSYYLRKIRNFCQ